MTMRAFVRWSVASVGVVALAYLALRAMVTERWAGDFLIQGALLIALIGGAVLAAVRFAFGRSDSRPVTDPFSRDVFSTDTVNISHVRVAGVGGAGLVIAALGVAAQYQLTTVAVILGICGGLIGATAVLVYRRVRHT